MQAWDKIITSHDKQIPTAMKPFLEEFDTVETLKFSTAHLIVAGLLSVSLKEQLDLFPDLVRQKDAYGEIPLFWAVKCNNLSATTLLLTRDSVVDAMNYTEETPLHYASTILDPRICGALLQSGAPPNALSQFYGSTPLIVACGCGNMATIAALLQAGADPNINPGPARALPALSIAARDGKVEVIETLCRYGADINLRSAVNGAPPITFAVQYNQGRSVRTLLRHGARLDILDDGEYSILHYAATYTTLDTMKVLMSAGIRGLPMDTAHIEQYWACFNVREWHYFGERASAEDERAAFQELLDSVQGAEETGGEDSEDDDDDQFVDAQE
jgi:ankyrin repeat protein